MLLTDVPAGMTPAAHRTLAVVALTGVLWFTGGVPLGAASLVPLVAFPLLGVLDAAAAANAYINKLVFLYLGGFLLALGLERWGVHERLALHVLKLTGSSPRRVVAGFMLTAAGLSMWISNTAATIMLLPVAVAMLDALKVRSGKSEVGSDGPASDGRALGDVPPRGGSGNEADAERAGGRLTVALLLGLAWAASLGGIATPVGTPTNLAFINAWQQSEAATGGDVSRFSFPNWIAAFAPVSAVMLLAAWGLLTWNLRPAPGLAAAGRGLFAERLRARGRLGVPERRMLLVFGLAAALWVIPGPALQLLAATDGGAAWLERAAGTAWFPLLAPDDSTIAVVCALLAFALPAGDPARPHERLLDWKTAERLPWDILLLFGAGLALAAAFESTGLSAWVGGRLGTGLVGLPAWVVVGAVCLTMTFLTECTSNVATCTIVLPVLASVAVALDLPPELLMLPAAASASCAFMLPVATPPNAIVFGSGRVTMAGMASRGLVLNLAGAALVTALTLLWVRRIL